MQGNCTICMGSQCDYHNSGQLCKCSGFYLGCCVYMLLVLPQGQNVIAILTACRQWSKTSLVWQEAYWGVLASAKPLCRSCCKALSVRRSSLPCTAKRLVFWSSCRHWATLWMGDAVFTPVQVLLQRLVIQGKCPVVYFQALGAWTACSVHLSEWLSWESVSWGRLWCVPFATGIAIGKHWWAVGTVIYALMSVICILGFPFQKPACVWKQKNKRSPSVTFFKACAFHHGMLGQRACSEIGWQWAAMQLCFSEYRSDFN